MLEELRTALPLDIGGLRGAGPAGSVPVIDIIESVVCVVREMIHVRLYKG